MIRPYFVFEITRRCNSNCLYCYNVWKQEKGYPAGELSISGIRRLFDKLLSEVTPAGVTIAGGEPLLHPETAETLKYLSTKSVAVGIATNGVFLDEEMAVRLAGAGVERFEISIPALDAGRYRRLMGEDGSGPARRALLLARQAGAKSTISFVITRLNMSDIGEVIDLAAAFSADSVSLNRFVPGGEGLRHSSGLLPSRDELEETLTTADNRSEKLGIPVAVTIPIEPCVIVHERFPHLHFGTCCCGKEKWVIDPLGNLRTCEQNPEILGSLFEKGFEELACSIRADRFRKDNLRAECTNCIDYFRCGGGCRFLGNN